MNELKKIFDKYGTDKSTFHEYYGPYDENFSYRREHKINLLEILFQVGSEVVNLFGTWQRTIKMPRLGVGGVNELWALGVTSSRFTMCRDKEAEPRVWFPEDSRSPGVVSDCLSPRAGLFCQLLPLHGNLFSNREEVPRSDCLCLSSRLPYLNISIYLSQP